ncbi:MAG: hypothetical protein ABUL60_07010 [Myxococcales bacterium]
MAASRSRFRCLLPTLVALSVAGVAAADGRVEVATASAPAGTDARLKQALSESVRSQIVMAGLEPKLHGYSISPALIQLRRFIEPGQKQARTVCVVELGLNNAQQGLVANVRGNASSVGASPRATLDAAAQAAVHRLPETLSALQDTRRPRVASR